MVAIAWKRSYRVIPTRYPTASIYDRIIDSRNFRAILEIEALTNPRIREEAGDYRKMRAEDAVSGPGSTPVMASFAYSGPSRFSDGTYGVYYAGHQEDTAIAESRYWTEKFLRATNEPSIDVDKRMYVAVISGKYDDLRKKTMSAKVYDPTSYDVSQDYGRKAYEANRLDGIVYRSVRHKGGECICVFRPRLVTKCRIAKYLQFRWDGQHITAVATITDVRS